PARATLRKYGVRFGAYHIYLPALLKPAPRVLATQLWALKHGGSERKGLQTIEQLAASGRTPIAPHPEIAKGRYRTAGYRVCAARCGSLFWSGSPISSARRSHGGPAQRA